MRTRIFLYALVATTTIALGLVVSSVAYAQQVTGSPLSMQFASSVADSPAIMLVNGHHGWHRGWRHGWRGYPYRYYGPLYGGYYYTPPAPFCPNPQTWDPYLGQWVCQL